MKKTKKQKKPYDEKIISIMSFALFALLCAEAYLKHRDDIEESVARLKSALNQGKPEDEAVETTAEVTEEGVSDNAE
ncbi:MAG: hypothetical protein MJ168_06140 [Clostridia bacterium]|nr:hypothetical protein [Clostridia bacterium]